MTKFSRRLLLATVLAMGFSAPAPAEEKLHVVASFSILGDITARIGGGRISLKTIVGANGDAHVHQPTPDDARAFADADLIIVNGLGFEGWLDRLTEASGTRGVIVVAADGVRPVGGNDPHAWQNAANAAIYAGNIVKALCSADRAGCEAYKANAFAYGTELAALDAEIKSAVARIPQDRRTVIMSHDAFGYFAAAYGVTILAPEGVSTDSEASAKDVAELIEQIRAQKASALFVENIADPRLIEQIARETGLKIGGELYSDALSDAGGPAPTYIMMMRHNMQLLADAMAGV